MADLLCALHETGKVKLIVSLNGNMKEEAIAARNYLRRLMPGIDTAIWYGLAPDGELRRGYCTERMTDEQILAAHVNALAPDVALSPSPFEGSWDRSTPFIRTKNIEALTACVFHDAIPHRFPAAYLHNDADRKTYERRFNAITNFDLVLCNSEFTNSEYKDIFGKTNSISISAGLSPSFSSLISNASGQLGLAPDLGRYVLYVGGMDWRKNVPLLVRGMAQVPEAIAGTLKLVIAGDNGSQYINPLRQTWEKAGLPASNLISTGWISDAQLAALYTGAAVTVQPSLMEGFGLTALEAMAAGSPFLSARGGAVAEVVGYEATLFDPYDPRDLSRQISRIINDTEFREISVAHGYERAKLFRWDKTATIMLDTLQTYLGAKATSNPPVLSERPNSEGRFSPPGRRLLMDVSSTLQSPVMSGIQRVIHKLSQGMATLNETGTALAQTELSYCRDELGWYSLSKVEKNSLALDPRARLGFEDNDTYFLLDSSWTFIEGQKRRLLDALVMGQEVIHGIHDIGPLTMPAFTDAGMPPAFRRWFEFILGYSTGIICVSRAVADEVYGLIEAIQLPRPMKIGYFSLGGDFADVEPDPAWLDFTGSRPTFLMVGTIEPRKAHWVALDAFEQLWRDGVDVNLLIIGKPGWDTRLLRSRLAHHSEANKRLFVKTGISDGELRAAYGFAQALIMTSYLEGFGLPVAEAGALGCPVILADIPVFREVSFAAPASAYFKPSDPDDLARCIANVLRDGFMDRDSRPAPWPTWTESAMQVQQVIFEGWWYKQYEPREMLPNTRLSDIGRVEMTVPLADSGRAHTMRCMEGPLLSENGDEIRFVIALRNDSDMIWSSYGRAGGGFDVNMGSHIYTANGNCLDFDNPRTHIPFVVAPGQEVFFPIRIASDWLAREGRYVGVEMVQEGVSWMGERLRLDLLQPRAALELPLAHQPSGKAAALQLVLARGPFTAADEAEKLFLITLYNTHNAPIFLTGAEDKPSVSISVLNVAGDAMGRGHVLSCCSKIAPGSYGLMCVSIPGYLTPQTASLSLEFVAGDKAAWNFDLSELKFKKNSREIEFLLETISDPEPIGEAAEPARIVKDAGPQVLNLDAYDDLSNEEFCRTMYSVLLNREVDDSGLNFYKWAIDTSRLTRLGAAKRIIHDNQLSRMWNIVSGQSERSEMTVFLKPYVRREEPIEQIEDALSTKIPQHIVERWVSNFLSPEELAHEIQKTLDPFFYVLVLIDQEITSVEKNSDDSFTIGELLIR
ncbi:glycosyltransferase [Acidisoma silvae]|uniref:Glycosyltransferase n=1 Tax=Acidisoma silvae TaxID=2802396 RepID=A0A963YWG0_9PROT|nr:glycosyltransferase [Acidisoma silvae]MCB8877565.1 glycosyltransferase [Acidisoma silvae]